jgi:hypothetical protein
MTRQEQIAKVRADIERGKQLAAERFEREFGMPCNQENVGRVIRRAAQLAVTGRHDISKADL